LEVTGKNPETFRPEYCFHVSLISGVFLQEPARTAWPGAHRTVYYKISWSRFFKDLKRRFWKPTYSVRYRMRIFNNQLWIPTANERSTKLRKGQTFRFTCSGVISILLEILSRFFY
jgi:hypothetical protein